MQEPTESAPLLLDSISWIDLTALLVLGVFCVLGLFRGLVWQLSRIVALVASYVAAGRYGPDLAGQLQPLFADGTPVHGLPLYVAYVMLFLGALVVLGVLAYFLDKLVGRFGLGFYNRLGGALLGGLTGSAIVLAGLSLIMMFVPESWGLAHAARASHSMEFSRRSLAMLGDSVPQPMRLVFGVEQVPGAGGGQVPGQGGSRREGGGIDGGDRRLPPADRRRRGRGDAAERRR